MEKNKKIETAIPDSLKKVSELLKADIILYNGDIDEAEMETLLKITTKTTRENVLFILCTYGGHPNCAYKIARRLQTKYKKFYLYVAGYCKSAGTLIAVGSDEIIMRDSAEFGPLDVQLPEKDELFRYSSGLNISETLSALRDETFRLFTSATVILAKRGLSTKRSTEIASNMAVGFISQAVSQIDLVRIGEIQRAGRIALAYGERLIADRPGIIDNGGLAHLVSNYPDHNFVIDYKEAKKIFKNIRKESAEEEILGNLLLKLIKNPKTEGEFHVFKLYPEEEGKNEKDEQLETDSGDGKAEGDKGATATEALERLLSSQQTPSSPRSRKR